jgi:hypothetical protein
MIYRAFYTNLQCKIAANMGLGYFYRNDKHLVHMIPSIVSNPLYRLSLLVLLVVASAFSIKWNKCQPLPSDQKKLTFTSPVRVMFEDQAGNWWFGSDREGVVRFDGDHWTYFTEADGLGDNQIRCIQEDRYGNLWFETGKGVSKYDGVTFTNYPDGLQWQFQDQLEWDWSIRSGDLWFGAGPRDGVYHLEYKQPHYLSFPPPGGKAANRETKGRAAHVYTLFEDTRNNMWFGTVGRGVIRYNGREFLYLNDNWPVVRAIHQDDQGTMWFGTNGAGLIRYDGKKLHNFTNAHALENPDFVQTGQVSYRPETMARIWSITHDLAGNLWIATIDAGVWQYDGEHLTHFTTGDGLTSLEVHTIYRDKYGNIFAGMGDGAVCWFDGDCFQKVY